MRIIGGRHRGRKLAALPDRSIRPTADRAREALFNIIMHRPEWQAKISAPQAGRILDIFAGTGALGLEALSRGARIASFIEQDRAAAKILRANIATLGEETACRILERNALDVGPADVPYDLIFLDPPYAKGLGGPALSAAIDGGWIGPNTLIILETSADETFLIPAPLVLLEERRYGAARFLFLERKHEAA